MMSPCVPPSYETQSPGYMQVHTVDFFRSLLDDPYTFGMVAANHALGDCYAMGEMIHHVFGVGVVGTFGIGVRWRDEGSRALCAGSTDRSPIRRRSSCSSQSLDALRTRLTPVVRSPAGAKPTAAMAIAVVPFAPASKVESDLYQMMAGALTVLREAGCQLVGGHSSEGAELAQGRWEGREAGGQVGG